MVKVSPNQKRLPLIIRDAVDAARNIPGLKRGVRLTLAAIVSFVDKADPSATVFARKEKIAQRADCTDRTVRTHLRQLEEEGYILSREQEHAQKTGKFKVTHLQLTDKLKTILGLDYKPDELSSLDVPKEEFSVPLKEGLSVPSSISNRQPHAKGATVPADLGFLAERMHPWGIFSLMKKAKAKGQTLSDVATCAKSRIETLDLRGGKAYKYLSALLLSGACFMFPAKQVRADECLLTVNEVAAVKIELRRSEWKGKSYVNRKGTKLFRFQSDGMSAVVIDVMKGTESVLPLFTIEQATPVVDAIDGGTLILSNPV